MKRRLRRARVVFLVAAFVVAAGFAIQGKAEARAYRRQLTSAYYHAFSELSTASRELDTALRKSLYTTPGPLRESLYRQIYAKALAAQYALGELPYGNVELERTAAFYAKAGDYAAALCREDGADALENLGALANVSRTLNQALDDLRLDLDAGALELPQVRQAEAALAQAVERGAQQLGGSVFQDVESAFQELPTLIYDGPFSEHMTRATPKALEGLPDVTQEQARQAAADFLHVSPAALTLLSAGEGTPPTYAFTLPQDGGSGYVEVTRQGGKVLCYFQDRAPGAPTMGAEEAVELAQNYLANWGFARMEPSYHIQREGAITIHFAPVVGDVYCYPDLVKVTIGLDDGTLLGYEAHGYLNQHRERAFEPPAVGRDAAATAVPQGLEVLSAQTALIPTAGGTGEVLTYEFKCQAADGSHVLVYVNAQTGQQQNILLLLEDETGTLTL